MHRSFGIDAGRSELHVGLERAQQQVPELVGVDGVEFGQGGVIVFVVDLIKGAVIA